MKDYFGNEIKIGDYIVYPYSAGSNSIILKIVKVVNFTSQKITVLKPAWYDNTRKTHINFPENSIIISEELAFEKEPMFKTLSD